MYLRYYYELVECEWCFGLDVVMNLRVVFIIMNIHLGDRRGLCIVPISTLLTIHTGVCYWVLDGRTVPVRLDGGFDPLGCGQLYKIMTGDWILRGVLIGGNFISLRFYGVPLIVNWAMVRCIALLDGRGWLIVYLLGNIHWHSSFKALLLSLGVMLVQRYEKLFCIQCGWGYL